MAAVTRHPRWCSDASPYPMDGLPVSTDQIEFSQPVKQIRRCKPFIFSGGRFSFKSHIHDKSDCIVTYLDIKRIQVKLMRNVGIILLRFKTVLRKDTPFECHRCGRPIITGHGVGKADD